MPISLIAIGTLLIVAGYNGTQQTLFEIVKTTYDKSKGLGAWVILALILGALATNRDLRELINAFMIMLCIGLLLTLKDTK